ncbi:MAG: hypothetical protein ACR2KT_09905 [Methylocella sp.]
MPSNIGTIVVDGIVAVAFDRAAHKDADFVPHCGRMGKQEAPFVIGKASSIVVVGDAFDCHDRRFYIDTYAVNAIVVRGDMVESAYGRASPSRGDTNTISGIIRNQRVADQKFDPARKWLKADSVNNKIPHDAMGDRQRPARVEPDASSPGLDPIDGQVSEVDVVIWPGVDGDGSAGAAVVDAGALDPRDADRLGYGHGAITRGIEHLDHAARTGLAYRELEGAAGTGSHPIALGENQTPLAQLIALRYDLEARVRGPYLLIALIPLN